MNIHEWLRSPPKTDEIRLKNGGKYIPYAIVVEKLNQLCGEHWSTYNFQETYVNIGRRILVTGHIEVEVNYKVPIGVNKNDMGQFDYTTITRRLSGAANFVLNKASNPHPSATVKSLAIMNAVKPLGRQFGWELNPENEEEKTDFAPIIKVEKVDVDNERQRLLALIEQSATLEEASSYKILAEQRGLVKEWTKKVKSLTK